MVRTHTEAEKVEKIEQIEDEIRDKRVCDRNISSVVLETPSYHNTKTDNIVVYLKEDTLSTVKADIMNFLLLDCSVSMKIDTVTGKEYDHITFELIEE